MTTIPTISQLTDNLLARLRAEFVITLNPFGDAFLVALAKGLAGLLWLYYQAVAVLQKNIWYDTADSEKNGGTLERFGRSILRRDPFQATAGQYTVSVTGTAGAIMPASTVFIADDTSEHPGTLFQIAAAYTLTGSGDTVVINALAGGLDSRLVVGDTLTASAPITNVNSVVTVTIENVTPIDAETTEAYRSKIDIQVKTEPGSWSAADYRRLGTSVAGVGQTYAYATIGATASVDVFIQGTAAVANPGPSASPSVITAYTTALELVRPLGVFTVNYASSTIRNVTITITMGTFAAFTATQKAAILAALTTFVNSVHPFIASCDAVADRNDVIATYKLNAVIAAAVPGYGFSGVAFTVAGTSLAYWQADRGEISFLTLVSYA